MSLTKEKILELLATDKRAVARALLVLTDRQTPDEQAQETTRYLNGRGFRPCHARRGVSMAKFFKERGFLTDKQIAYWRFREAHGEMRIGIYWRQLLEEAQWKAQQAAKARPSLPGLTGSAYSLNNPNHPNHARRDYGNDMERRAVLWEQYNDVLDSDDEKLYGPLKDEIDEIDAYWNQHFGK